MRAPGCRQWKDLNSVGNSVTLEVVRRRDPALFQTVAVERRNEEPHNPGKRWGAMPLYHFHICDGEGFCEDPQGIELVDRDAAYAEALRGARSLMVEEIIQGRLNLASFIEVEDENGELLFTVTFEEAVEIDPRPAGGPKPRRS